MATSDLSCRTVPNLGLALGLCYVAMPFCRTYLCKQRSANIECQYLISAQVIQVYYRFDLDLDLFLSKYKDASLQSPAGKLWRSMSESAQTVLGLASKKKSFG